MYIFNNLCATITWNSCHSIRTGYLRVHSDMMGKDGMDKLT